MRWGLAGMYTDEHLDGPSCSQTADNGSPCDRALAAAIWDGAWPAACRPPLFGHATATRFGIFPFHGICPTQGVLRSEAGRHAPGPPQCDCSPG